jgi:hypothetical protein
MGSGFKEHIDLPRIQCSRKAGEIGKRNSAIGTVKRSWESTHEGFHFRILGVASALYRTPATYTARLHDRTQRHVGGRNTR